MTPNTETRLAARIDQLTDEVSFLRRELGLVRDQDRIASIKARHRFTGREVAICDVLLAKAPDVAIAKEALFGAAWGADADEIEIKIVDVYICKIRAKIGKDAIETIWGTGYRLTPVGRALLSGASA